MNLYELLGLPATASPAEIRASYRALAKRHHPDTKTGSQEQFAALNLANQVLSDPVRRAQYDANGSIDHKSLESERGAILDIVASALAQAIQSSQQDPANFDLLTQVKNVINSKIQEGDVALARHKLTLAKFDQIIQRTTAKKKTADPALLSILAQQRGAVAAALATDTATCARFKAALGLLKDYKYEFTSAAANLAVDSFTVYQQQQGSAFFQWRK